jgi:hypothetical protein
VGLIPGEELGPSKAMVLERVMELLVRPVAARHPPKVEWVGGLSATGRMCPRFADFAAVSGAPSASTG